MMNIKIEVAVDTHGACKAKLPRGKQPPTPKPAQPDQKEEDEPSLFSDFEINLLRENMTDFDCMSMAELHQHVKTHKSKEGMDITLVTFFEILT